MTELQRLEPDCPEPQPDTPQRKAACAAASLFKAMSDPTRLQMLLLLRRNQGRMCARELESHFDLQQPTISHHLRVLRQAGLIDCERCGLWAYYFIRPKALEPLRSMLEALALQ